MRRSSLALTIGCALAAAGCTPFDGPARHPARAAAVAVAPRRATPPPVRQTPAAESAIRAFATAYINWTAQTVTNDMLALAAASTGQARAATELAAAETANDYELHRGGVANSGTVEAIAPLLDHHNQYVVVTRELTTASNTTAYQGLQPAWHVAVATVDEVRPRQWVVSGWQPES